MNILEYVYDDICTLSDKKQRMFWNLFYNAEHPHLSRAIMPRKYIQGRFLQITCGMHAHYKEMETLMQRDNVRRRNELFEARMRR
jgi:hypothetical protein